MSSSVEPDPLTGLPIGRLLEPPLTAEWPGPVTLRGQWVRLEPLSPEVHGESLWQLVGGGHQAALWQYMAEGPFADREAFYAAMRNQQERRDPKFFAILDERTGLAVGRCAYLNIKPNYRCIEVGHILFSSQLQKTRGATEALYLMARHAFEDLGYRRYEWKCNALNVKSRQAAERFGFVFEGIFRQHMIVKGRSRDSAWFSMLAEEWPARRRALEAWLAPDNFDAEGKQRKPLSAF